MNAPEAATALVAARLSGAGLDKMPHGVPLDGSTADGYHIQDAMIAQPGALGALVGWKARALRMRRQSEGADIAPRQIGATNAAAQASMGFGPFYGPLFASAQLGAGSAPSLLRILASCASVLTMRCLRAQLTVTLRRSLRWAPPSRRPRLSLRS
jgi:hypothetical protein